MAPSPRTRVLRCCSCQLFQAHQVKKSLKWTCKACGEKQSFVRAYGEGSGADCRRHVQKLNLLQGQVSELSLRHLGEAAGGSEGENSGLRQPENRSVQGKPQPLESRWLKYLDKDFKEQKLGGGRGGGGGNLQTQLASSCSPNPPYSSALTRKRKWSQSPAQPSCFLGVQDLDNAEGTLECQGSSGLTGMQQSSSHCLETAHCHPSELDFPQWKPPSPALQAKAPASQWAQFLLSTLDSPHVGTEPARPLHWGSRPASPTHAEQGIPETKTPREGHLNKAPTTVHLPQAAHDPTPRLERPSRKIPKLSGSTRTPQAPPTLYSLFITGEDFDDDL